MRTKEQIQDLLMNVVFTDKALYKILGFMIGSGLKEESETMKYCFTDDNGTEWSFFWDWFNEEFEVEELEKKKEECDKCPLCDMLNELIREMENETDPKKVQRAIDRYRFLVESFELDD